MARKKTSPVTSKTKPKAKPKKAFMEPDDRGKRRTMLDPRDPGGFKGFEIESPGKKPARGGKAGAPSHRAAKHSKANIAAREKKMGRKLTTKERAETTERSTARTAERQRARQTKTAPQKKKLMSIGGGRIPSGSRRSASSISKATKMKAPGGSPKSTSGKARPPMIIGGGSVPKSSGGTRTTKTRRTVRSARRR